MSNQPKAVFNLFRESMLSKTDDWMNLIADNVSLIGPLAQVAGKESFIEVSAPFFGSIIDSNLLQVIEKENHIITQISNVVATPSGKQLTLDICEWYEIKENKLVALKVYFDPSELIKEMNPG